ncbi:hypothetical protein O6P43_026818 [Quillaja saponaria]|uniref:Uncharacterized protein n=1 Tax=Quillaja saponaria TaxID=32244 RepID=A0AAD7L3F1_QUISA|nr:hypothetical protein O6P43_026818 [Quillaja saponaria]
MGDLRNQQAYTGFQQLDARFEGIHEEMRAHNQKMDKMMNQMVDDLRKMRENQNLNLIPGRPPEVNMNGGNKASMSMNGESLASKLKGVPNPGQNTFRFSHSSFPNYSSSPYNLNSHLYHHDYGGNVKNPFYSDSSPKPHYQPYQNPLSSPPIPGFYHQKSYYSAPVSNSYSQGSYYSPSTPNYLCYIDPISHSYQNSGYLTQISNSCTQNSYHVSATINPSAVVGENGHDKKQISSVHVGGGSALISKEILVIEDASKDEYDRSKGINAGIGKSNKVKLMEMEKLKKQEAEEIVNGKNTTIDAEGKRVEVFHSKDQNDCTLFCHG